MSRCHLFVILPLYDCRNVLLFHFIYPSYFKLQVCWLRYKAHMSLALKGQRFALFNTQYVLSCNSNYFGYSDNDVW
ncbi:hypothetical protein EF878_07530 [Dickeya undicola]|uniref:Uncharacterized protein n=1 Tax=Dickeya undicola TaxID=1577887 RepID=A0A3N0G4U5_9GAMM|nr:hypothetical protein EF878_07530 [Dickeya undicola]